MFVLAVFVQPVCTRTGDGAPIEPRQSLRPPPPACASADRLRNCCQEGFPQDSVVLRKTLLRTRQRCQEN
eukprot:2237595-Lingulodinium_polyedra.AAC.1